MSSVKRNIVVNYLGQAWVAVMGLAFLPLYIQYLGMEAYGLIGLFAVMQAWLSLLDMGMTPTLNREMARFTAGAHSPQSIRDLLHSLEVLCLSFAVLVAVAVWVASDWLASDWLKAEKLPITVVSQALSVMAFVAALRFVEGIYRGALLGLQRQVWYNGASALLAILRHGGAVLVLAWLAPTVHAFFMWQAIISILTIIVLATAVHRSLPRASQPPRFSKSALADVWKFAGGMVGTTFLTLLLTQVDKVLLSRLLTLEAFGYYTLAAAVASVPGLFTSPIAQAVYPRLTELATRNDQLAIISIYHQSAQLVTILTCPVVLLLVLFPAGGIFVWTGDAHLAGNIAPILAALTLGNFFSGLMIIPYMLQLSHGWTSLTVKINIVAVTILVPAIFWIVTRHGAIGAAWTWVALNASFSNITIQFMHRRLIPQEKGRWYLADVLIPASGALGIVILAQQFKPAGYQDRWHWLSFLLITGSLALAVSTALADRIRPRLLSIMGRCFLWRYL